MIYLKYQDTLCLPTREHSDVPLVIYNKSNIIFVPNVKVGIGLYKALLDYFTEEKPVANAVFEVLISSTTIALVSICASYQDQLGFCLKIIYLPPFLSMLWGVLVARLEG